MTILKTIMHQHKCNRSIAHWYLREIQQYKKMQKELAYRLIYIGDKPGEGTNIGRGLVNAD